jgi:tRNA(Ile)-lysidine synthase
MAQFIKTVQNFAFQSDLWERGSKIIVGVSGGPDSACLLDILVNLSHKYDFSLHICHVNYGLRGKDSDLDEELVLELAKKYDVGISLLQAKKKVTGNLEEQLRAARYDFFEKERQRLGFDLIAVAHNQDDQAETVIMRLIRGSGLQGMASMKAKNGKIIRPLLGLARIEILQYCASNKLKFRHDKSNDNQAFMRNRIRHNLLPYLEKNFNPAIKKTLSHAAFTVADDYDYIQQSSKKGLAVKNNGKELEFSASGLLKKHPALQRSLLRQMLLQAKNDLLDIEAANVEEILKMLKSTKGKNQKTFFKGLNIQKKGDIVRISCK